jgi:hypothetical protein
MRQRNTALFQPLNDRILAKYPICGAFGTGRVLSETRLTFPRVPFCITSYA